MTEQGSSEVPVTAITCALAGHPPQLMTAQADTRQRPITCGCGQRVYAVPEVPREC